MARDPKAKVVSVGEFKPYEDPTYGKGAVRRVQYEDGTIEYRFFHYDSQKDKQGPPDQGYLIREEVDPTDSNAWRAQQRLENPKPTPKTQEEITRQQQEIEAAQRKAEEDTRKTEEYTRDKAEREANLLNLSPGQNRGYYENNQERAAREIREQADQRAEDARQQALRNEKQQAENQRRSNELAQGNLEVSRGNLTLAQEKEARDAAKPTFLSQADENNPFLIRFNPESGLVESMGNPNFDRVKQESERLRSMIAVQIQGRQLDLEAGKQQYQQWYDQNVKTPMLLAQEARDKAAEQRAALDSEERRRQFAASFSLQKGELGQRAGAAAMQAEESLLPYRAGPTESAEMSSAINSLGAGGSMSANAGAGIHFTPGAFEFDAPDFKSIAKQAAAAALSGISSYKPSSQTYQTGDYSNVPAVNTSGAPAVPQGSSAFQGLINQLQSTYNFGGSQAPTQ